MWMSIKRATDNAAQASGAVDLFIESRQPRGGQNSPAKSAVWAGPELSHLARRLNESSASSVQRSRSVRSELKPLRSEAQTRLEGLPSLVRPVRLDSR